MEKELDHRVTGDRIIHQLGMRVPMTMHSPEGEGFNHQARRDGGIREWSQEVALHAYYEVVRKRRDQAASGGVKPQRSQLRPIVSGAIEQLNPMSVAGEGVIQFGKNRGQLGAGISHALTSQGSSEGRKRLVLR